MLPPNILGSLNNLTRAGILDCGTASYVACGSSPYMYNSYRYSPYRYRYSNLMTPFNPYMDAYYNPNNKGMYSLDPRVDTIQRKNFVRRAIDALFIMGGVYLGGKGVLRLSKGAKTVASGAEAAGTEAQRGIRGFFSRIKNAFSGAGTTGASGATGASGTAGAVTGTTVGTGGAAGTTGATGATGTTVRSWLKNLRNRISRAGESVAGMTKRVFTKGGLRLRP